MGKLGTAIKVSQRAVQVGRSAQELHATTAELRTMNKGDLSRAAGHAAFNEGADTGKTIGKTWLKTFEVLPRMICRGLQFLFAMIACGFYGNRVDANREGGGGFAPEWLFAITICSLSAITSVLYCMATPLGALPFIGSKLKLVKTYRAFSWDLALFICWLVAFGLFAGIFLHRDNNDAYKGAKPATMKIAVWIDLVNVLLWLTSGVYGALKTYLGDKADQMTDKLGKKMFEKKAKPAKEAVFAESV